MIKWKGKEYRGIFDMDINTLEDWCNNSKDFAKQVKHDMKTNLYFNAEECCI